MKNWWLKDLDNVKSLIIFTLMKQQQHDRWRNILTSSETVLIAPQYSGCCLVWELMLSWAGLGQATCWGRAAAFMAALGAEWSQDSWPKFGQGYSIQVTSYGKL